MRKHRRVIVTLEIETARSLSVLRRKLQWEAWAGMKVHQIQVNVIRPEKPTKGGFRPNVILNAKRGTVEFVGFKATKRRKA